MRPSASGSVPADARSNPLAPVPPPFPMILSPIIQLSEHKESSATQHLAIDRVEEDKWCRPPYDPARLNLTYLLPAVE